MKKLIALVLVIISTIGLTACGNKKLIEFDNTYDYAIIQRYDGEQRIDLDSWTDYEGEQLQLYGKDGKIYLVSSFNTILVHEQYKMS